MGVAAYKGPFGREQAERLLWRAGFGPRKGEAAALAKLGLDGAVRSLTRPKGEKFVGPAPRDDKGRGLAPGDAWGHDHLWWLDRMVRTSRPLVERMTLVWHDWFATSLAGVGSQKLMLNQNKLLRRLSLGSFDTMLREVTKDPAMLLWLSGTENTKWSPNENYARELMELFTLGAGRGLHASATSASRRARSPASTTTGSAAPATSTSATTASATTRAASGSSASAARSTGRTPCRLCLTHPKHASFFVDKLWHYFIPVAPDAGTRRVARGALPQGLRDPARRRGDPPPPGALHRPADGEAAGRLHAGPAARRSAAASTRPPGRGSRPGRGQRLFMPPNVAGWDDERWLDTATFRGRWWVANYATQPYALTDKQAAALPAEPAALVDARDRVLGLPHAPPGHPRRAAHVREPRDGRREREVEADELPLPDRERAPPADRRLPRPPDLAKDDMARCCNDFSRTDLLRRAAAEAGRGLPAIEHGMPLPGRHRARPAQLPRPQRRPRARRLRRRRVACRARSRRASPQRPRPGRRRCSSPSSSTAAPTRSRCSSRTATRSTGSCARGWRCRRRPGSRSPRTAASAGTPRSARSRSCTARARSR